MKQVPIVIMKTKDMRNSTNIFLTNLSIADLLVLLVCTPTVLVEVYSKPETWVLGQEMCKLESKFMFLCLCFATQQRRRRIVLPSFGDSKVNKFDLMNKRIFL